VPGLHRAGPAWQYKSLCESTKHKNRHTDIQNDTRTDSGINNTCIAYIAYLTRR